MMLPVNELENKEATGKPRVAQLEPLIGQRRSQCIFLSLAIT
jgi:hypothetical protein